MFSLYVRCVHPMSSLYVHYVSPVCSLCSDQNRLIWIHTHKISHRIPNQGWQGFGREGFRRIIPPRLNNVAGLQGEKPPLTSIKLTILPSPCRPTNSALSGLPNKDSVVSLYGRALFYLSFFHANKDQNCCDYMKLYWMYPKN